ncbi:DEAD/DEAH box helicase family protein [Streptomyces platensis]|uniref:helicase associated domain-containing protein n=1 Tax=Streptomyces platensis TaxID=58346 RepID=UPI00369E606F
MPVLDSAPSRNFVRPALHPHQAEGLQRAVRHLGRPGGRGLYVAATGTGKTLVSIRVADELKARMVLFVVPTLDLAAQTALAWRRDGHLEHMVIMSSMDAAGREDLVEARVGSTDAATSLAALLSVVGEGSGQIPTLTVICTYDSLDKIEQTQKTQFTVPPFDLAVMDEAHRIAGRADKKWAVVHDTNRPRRRRRIGPEPDLDAYGHLDVPADYTDPTGYALGTFITTMRDARTAGRLEADWIAELDVLGMIWDKHDAAWRARLTATADYRAARGHLAAPATTPVGAWLAEQRHQRPARPSTCRRPGRTRSSLAPAPRRGLAPQIPPAPWPSHCRPRPGRPHPRHPSSAR